MFSVLNLRINYILIIIVVSFIFEDAVAFEFSSRKNFNKLLNGFYKNDLYQCRYINKSWSTGFKQHPYGMVVNDGAFKNVLVFNNKGVIGTLWPNIGEISVDRGVRKYQLWKKINSEEYELLNSDFLEDSNSADVNVNGNVISEYKTYFSSDNLKISVKPWITDFYSCEIIESSNFAKKKLIDIFVNQNNYVKKDFAYREKNPSLFSNKIELLRN